MGRTSMTVALLTVLASLALGGCAGEVGREEATETSRSGLETYVNPEASLEMPSARLVNGHAVEDRHLTPVVNAIDVGERVAAADVKPALVNKRPGLDMQLHAPSGEEVRLDSLTLPTERLASPDGMDDRIDYYRGAQGEIADVVTFGATLSPKEALVAHGMQPLVGIAAGR